MGQAGIFAPDSRLELIEGEIFEMAPIGSRHAGIVTRLNRWFVERAAGRAVVWSQNPVIASPRSVPQPDLLLLCPRPDDYMRAHPVPADVLLLVEVADSTLAFDLRTKVPLYARSGIAEAWVVDVEGRVVHVFRQPQDGRYASQFTAAIGEQLECGAVPAVRVEIEKLFA